MTNRERIGEREMECVNKRYPKEMELKCIIERFFFLSNHILGKKNDQN